MKKIITLVLMLALLCASMCSCFLIDEDYEKNKDTTEASVTTNEEKKTDDYDENGNFIMTSTEDRYVYAYKNGYLVFTFNDAAVSKIQHVFAFADQAAAQEYVKQVTLDAVEKGEVPPTITVSGVYAIERVPFVVGDQTGISSYYVRGKSAVEADFANEVKQ